MHMDKELAMRALKEAEDKFNEVIGDDDMDPAYFKFSAKAEIIDIDFEETLWECEIKE